MNEALIFAELIKIIDPQEKKQLSILMSTKDIAELRNALVYYLKKYRRKLVHLF